MDQSTTPTQPSSTRPSGHRDMMFCHECHDEWYRDEHGIFCPECHSEFTEIIEEGNDPRDNAMLDHDHDDDDDDDDTDSMPSLEEAPSNRHPLHDLHDHNPWRNSDDPEEADISTMRFQPLGPGRFQVSATIHRTVSPAALGNNNGNGPNTVGGFASFLGNLLGGGLGGGRPPGQPPGQQSSPGTQAGGGQGNPETRSRAASPPGVHRFTYTAGARLYPRDANHPEPHLEPVDDLNNVLAGIMAAFGEPPGGQHGGHPHIHTFGGEMPLNPILALFGAMSGGQHGDFVYSQEALDRIISQLMEQTATSNAPGPASQEDINALPRKPVTEDMLGAEGRAECSICMDEVHVTEEVTELPCKHWFHHQCVAAWLSEHDTCPHCRKGITKPSANAGNNSSSGNATSSGVEPTSSMPGAFGVTGEGTPENPFIVPGPIPPSTNPNQNPDANATQGGATEGSGSGSSGSISDRLRRGLFGPHS